MPKRLSQVLAATSLVYAAFAFCVNAQAWAYPLIVESESSLDVRAQAHRSRVLDLRLLDESQRGIKNASIKLVLTRASGEILLNKDIVTDAFGRAQIDIDLPPGHYLLNLDYLGDRYIRASRYQAPHEVQFCDANLELSLPRRLWWQRGKPIELDLRRPLDCIDLDLALIASFGPTPAKRVTFKKGQAELKLRFETENLKEDVYLLTLECLDDLFFKPLTETVAFFVYAQIFDPLPVWRDDYYSTWIDLFVSETFANVEQDLPELLAFAQVSDAKGRQLSLDANDGGTGQWTFVLPDKQWTACAKLEVWPEGSRALGQSFSICQETSPAHSSKFWQSFLLALGALSLSLSLWGLSRLYSKRLKKTKPSLPKPHTVDRENFLAESIAKVKQGFSTVVQKPKLIKVFVTDQESKKGLSDLKLELWEHDLWKELSQTQTSTQAGFEILSQTATRLRVTHPDYLRWEGRLKNEADELHIEMMTRRQYVILCFEAVSQSLLSQVSPWGSISPARVASFPKDSKDSRPELRRFCALVEIAAFKKTQISDEEIEEIYKLARQCLR